MDFAVDGCVAEYGIIGYCNIECPFEDPDNFGEFCESFFCRYAQSHFEERSNDFHQVRRMEPFAQMQRGDKHLFILSGKGRMRQLEGDDSQFSAQHVQRFAAVKFCRCIPVRDCIQTFWDLLKLDTGVIDGPHDFRRTFAFGELFGMPAEVFIRILPDAWFQLHMGGLGRFLQQG